MSCILTSKSKVGKKRPLGLPLSLSVADNSSSRWHKTTPPPKDVTAGVNYVITAFAPSTTFNSGSSYQPFMPLDQVRALFDKGTKVCMAIGGWGDTSGFSTGAATETTRKTYAKNVATALTTLGYDCIGKTFVVACGDECLLTL